ncbi:MAG TPA: glycosyltransferase family A protein [Verrucomicrobiae bacterium]|nr:glycosyltransferase family A protein [Verrucomicrobiae bacterium]
MNATDYVIISPVRNEAAHLQKTIDSVVAQTVRPREWILVNDGSTDQTRQIIDAAAGQFSWIRAIHRPDRGFRKSGGGVIEAFYDGYDALAEKSPEFIAKLDGDLSFQPDYFENCFEHFRLDSKIGIGGGLICSAANDSLLQEESKGDPPFHVRGATKIYRCRCWKDITPLAAAPGWDTLDEIKANMLGWKTLTFRELKLLHFRHAGDADGAWRNWMKNGFANYLAGYHPLFMLAKCVKRFFSERSLIAAAGLACGFLKGYCRRLPRIADAQVMAYLRHEQLKRLSFQPSLWRPA